MIGDALWAQTRRLARLDRKKGSNATDILGLAKNNGLTAYTDPATATSRPANKPAAVGIDGKVATSTGRMATQGAKAIVNSIRASEAERRKRSPYKAPTAAMNAAVNYRPPADPVLTPAQLRERQALRSSSPSYDPTQDAVTAYGGQVAPQDAAFTRIKNKAAKGRYGKGEDDFTTALKIASQMISAGSRGVATGVAAGATMNAPEDVRSGFVDAVQGNPALTNAPLFIPGIGQALGGLQLGAGLLSGGADFARDPEQGKKAAAAMGEEMAASMNPLQTERINERTGQKQPSTYADRLLAGANLLEMFHGGVKGAATLGEGKGRISKALRPAGNVARTIEEASAQASTALGFNPGSANLDAPTTMTRLRKGQEQAGATIKVGGPEWPTVSARKGMPRNAGKLEIGQEVSGITAGRKGAPEIKPTLDKPVASEKGAVPPYIKTETGTFVPDEVEQMRAAKEGYTPVAYRELDAASGGADEFVAAIDSAKASQGPLGVALTVYDAPDYKGMRLFLSEDGKAGFALKGDDIVSVFKHKDAPIKGASRSVMRLAIQEGGRRLDAFDTVLPHLYSKDGMKVQGRLPFNDEYAPDGWDYDAWKDYNGGRPDVVFMSHDPETGPYTPGEGKVVEDYDQGGQLQQRALSQPTQAQIKDKMTALLGEPVDYTESSGWIAPDGKFYANGRRRSHGDVAAEILPEGDGGYDGNGLRDRGWIRSAGGGVHLSSEPTAAQLKAIRSLADGNENFFYDIEGKGDGWSGTTYRDFNKDFSEASKERKLNPAPRQAGMVDVKLLGGIAAAGGLTVAAFGNKDVREWMEEQGAGTLIKDGAAILGVAAILFGSRRGAKMEVTPEQFRTTRWFVSPRVVGERGINSPEGSATHGFGKAVNAVVGAQGERLYRTGQGLKAIDEAGTQSFGKKWQKSEAFTRGNNAVRGIMEENTLNNREWHEGLTPEWRGFIEKVRPVLSDIVDEFESLGGSVKVKNDGTQVDLANPEKSKVNVGDKLYIGGEQVRVVGFEGGKNEPFASRGKDAGKANLNAAEQALQNAKGGPNDRLIPKIVVETINPSDPKQGAVLGNLIRNKMVAEGLDPGKAPVGERRVILPNESFGRPIYRLDEAFVPRILSSDLVDRLRNGRVEAAEREALATSIKDAHPEYGDVSTDEAIGYLTDLTDGMQSGSNVRSFLKNLETERGIVLAKYEYVNAKGETVTVDPYESSYVDAVGTYLDRANKRVAIMRQLGPDSGQLAEMTKALYASNPMYGEYVEQLLGDTLGIGPRVKDPKETVNRLGSFEGAYQTLTKLTTGGTHFAQLNDVTLALSEAGVGPAMRGLLDLAIDRNGIRAEADIVNAIHANWIRDMRLDEAGAPVPSHPIKKTLSGAGLAIKGAAKGIVNAGKKALGMEVKAPATGIMSEGLARMADGVMTGIGIRYLDKSVKRVTAATILRDAEESLAKAAKTKGIPKGALARKLDRYGLTKEIGRARKEGVKAVMDDRLVVEQLAGRIREGYQYSGAAEDLPQWMSSGGGSIVARFKKPAYVTTRFVLRNVVNEAVNGNLVPLARLLTIGVGVGAAAGYGKDVIRGVGLDDETHGLWDDGDKLGAIKRFFAVPAQESAPVKVAAFVKAKLEGDPQAGKDFAQMLWTGGKALYDGGGLGIFGDLNPAWNRRVQDMQGSPIPEVEGLVAPLAYTSARNVMQSIAAADSEFSSENTAQAEAELTNALRMEVPGIRRLLDLFPQFKPDLLKLRDIQAKETRALNAMPPAARKGTPHPLGMGDYIKQAALTQKTKGRFEEIRKIKEDAQPPSKQDVAFEAVGVTKSGTALPRKGTRR